MKTIRTCKQCGVEFDGNPQRWKCDSCIATNRKAGNARRPHIDHTPYRKCPICPEMIPWHWHESVNRYNAKKTCGKKACRLLDRPKKKYVKTKRWHSTYLSEIGQEMIIRQIENKEIPNRISECDTLTCKEGL